MSGQRPAPRTTPTAARPFRYGDDWWRRGVVYQIYPRSFADSDGDGTGDLRGITAHLPYLGPDGLAVDAIWLSPIYPSPGRDIGYDVSDHTSIDPLFGSEADFDELVATAHGLGIRVVLDLVMNHTSDEHAWFIASRRRQEPYTDWYIWRDSPGTGRDGAPLPPNDWVSWFGGPAWTFDPVRGQAFHHTFLAEQPELDWRVPAVEAAQWSMVRGWLERGVDGFRLDTFNVFLKDAAMRSNPPRRGSTAWDRQVHVHDYDQPDLPALIERFRSVVDEHPGRMSVGELFAGSTEGAASLTRDRHLVFDWELLTRPWSAAAFRAALRRRERAFGDDRWPTIVLSNHDQPRHASRLADSTGASEAERDAIARAAAVLSPDRPWHAVPVLRRGARAWATSTSRPTRASTRRPPGSRPTSRGGIDRGAGRRCPGPREPGAGFTTGRRGCASARTRRPATSPRSWPIPTRCWPAIAGSSPRVSRAPRSRTAGCASARSATPMCSAYRRLGPRTTRRARRHRLRRGRWSSRPAAIGRAGGRWRPVVGSHRELPVVAAGCTLGRAARLRGSGPRRDTLISAAESPLLRCNPSVTTCRGGPPCRSTS